MTRTLVHISVHPTPSFPGTYHTLLDEQGAPRYRVLCKSFGHDTWAEAARAALALADQHNYLVVNRELIERRIRGPQC